MKINIVSCTNDSPVKFPATTEIWDLKSVGRPTEKEMIKLIQEWEDDNNRHVLAWTFARPQK